MKRKDLLIKPFSTEKLAEYLNELAAASDELQKSVEKSKEGSLHVVMRGDYCMYYHRKNAKDKSGTYIKKRNIDVAKALAQKDYDIAVLKEIHKEKKMIEKFLLDFDETKVGNLFSKENAPRKQLITPIAMNDADFECLWKRKEYEKKPVYEDSEEYITENGEHVRSKSEILIANALKQNGIPYRYEYPVSLFDGRVRHPDFCVLNVRERKNYYWEHCGKVGEEEYGDYISRKMNDYAKSGLVPGKDIIITLESKNVPLNMNTVQGIIDAYLK